MPRALSAGSPRPMRRRVTPCARVQPLLFPRDARGLQNYRSRRLVVKSGRLQATTPPEDWPMHIITRKRLNEFAVQHPNAKPGLTHWYRTLKPATIHSFAELRALFPSADHVGK